MDKPSLRNWLQDIADLVQSLEIQELTDDNLPAGRYLAEMGLTYLSEAVAQVRRDQWTQAATSLGKAYRWFYRISKGLNQNYYRAYLVAEIVADLRDAIAASDCTEAADHEEYEEYTEDEYVELQEELDEELAKEAH